MEDEDFLAAVEADNANETVTEPAPEPVVETPQDSEVAEQPAPAEQPVNPLTAPVIEAKPEPGFVPITVVLDEREKRQRAEQERDRLLAQQPQPPAAQAPDMLEDPEGYNAYVQQTVEERLLNMTLNTSERFAKKEHGAEKVEAAKAWALQRYAADPLYREQVLRDPDPYERVINDFQREQIAAEVQPDEFAQFKAWKAAQAQIAQPQQQAAPAAPPSPAIPPRSLASAPSAGGVNTEVAQSDEEVFAEIFTRK